MYTLYTDRHTLAVYLAWEIETKRAVELMMTAKRTDLGFRVPLIHNTTLLKRNAHRMADRIACIAAYQDGRLGKSLVSRDIHIVKS